MENNKNEKIVLDKEIQQLCNASSLEALNYYLVFPNQLVLDAETDNKEVKEYLFEIFMKSSKQLNNINKILNK